MKIEQISDSVRLVSVKTDKFKTSKINFAMATPLSGNISAKAILPYLLHRRSKKYPDRLTLNRVIDELYGAVVTPSVTKIGEAQVIGISITGINDKFAIDDEKISVKCANLLFEMVFNPLLEGESFPETVVESEKRLLSERLASELNDKRRYALTRCEELMFSEEAYGKNRLGSLEEISQLTAKDIYHQWQDVLKTAVMQVTVVGNAASDEISDLLKKKFSGINRKPAKIETEFFAGMQKPEYICEKLDVKQGKLVIGLRTGMRSSEDNVYAMRVATDIFGGGTYSKLFSVVREKMSLCYYCSAQLFAKKGVIMVQSGIEEENEEKAKNEILNQLSSVANGEFTKDDLSSSLKSLADSRISVNDTPESLCSWYSTQILSDIIKTPEQSAQGLAQVDKAEVIAAAKTIKLDTVYMLKGNGEGCNNED